MIAYSYAHQWAAEKRSAKHCWFLCANESIEQPIPPCDQPANVKWMRGRLLHNGTTSSTRYHPPPKGTTPLHKVLPPSTRYHPPPEGTTPSTRHLPKWVKQNRVKWRTKPKVACYNPKHNVSSTYTRTVDITLQVKVNTSSLWFTVEPACLIDGHNRLSV